jgi:hypothetical protein
MTAKSSLTCVKRKAVDNEIDCEISSSYTIFDDCGDIVDTNTYRSGLLTCRMRPCNIPIPRLKLSRYYRMKLDGSESCPDFAGIPGWLKPFLHHHHQMGCRAERLCSLFRNLPDDLLSAIRTACITVVVLALQRMMMAKDTANRNILCRENGLDKMEDEPWLYEGLGLSDDELDTYDKADFGILR